MAISEEDLQVLRALTEARQHHEELAELLDFYYDLYEVQFRAKAGLPDPELRDEVARRWRLEGGIPQLTFDQLQVEAGALAHLVEQVAGVFLRHNPTWQIDLTLWGPDKLLTLAQEVFRSWDTPAASQPEAMEGDAAEREAGQPIALIVGFALVPYLQRAAEGILPHLDLSLWAQGYCPVCGGRPNLALLDEERGGRQLICSRCTARWGYSRFGCPFCRSKEKQIYYPSEDGAYRLYVCPSCKRYLKTIDLRETRPTVYPLVERLLTVGMDLAAQREGFGS